MFPDGGDDAVSVQAVSAGEGQVVPRAAEPRCGELRGADAGQRHDLGVGQQTPESRGDAEEAGVAAGEHDDAPAGAGPQGAGDLVQVAAHDDALDAGRREPLELPASADYHLGAADLAPRRRPSATRPRRDRCRPR